MNLNIQSKPSKSYTICLNMIVKNESHIITKTLENLTRYVDFDAYYISDTGSTDNTKELIKENHIIVRNLVVFYYNDFTLRIPYYNSPDEILNSMEFIKIKSNENKEKFIKFNKNIFMKPFLLTLTTLLFCVTLQAQTKLPAVDKSPMDMSYYPVGYPVQKMQGKVIEPLVARVIYSRPQKNGRVVFGELVEYGRVWRLGANEATEIEFFKDVVFGKTKIKKGRYSLFAIPFEKKWTIILNKETDTWGAFGYDIKKDVLRMDVTCESLIQPVENFSIVFDVMGNKVNMEIYWDNVKAVVPFAYLNNK